MSRCNPAHPLVFRRGLWWQGGDQVTVFTASREGLTIGYFNQGSDGQWWWFTTGDEFGQCEALSISNLNQIVATCNYLNANGDIPQ